MNLAIITLLAVLVTAGIMLWVGKPTRSWRTAWRAIALFTVIWIASIVAFVTAMDTISRRAHAALDDAGYGEHVLMSSPTAHCSWGELTVTFIAQGGRNARRDGLENTGFICVSLLGYADVHETGLPPDELPDWEPRD